MSSTEAAAEQHLAAAIAAHQKGDGAAAETLYRKVLQIRPDDAQAHYLLGALAFQANAFARARESLERAHALRPGHLPTRSMLGAVLSGLGQADASVAHFAAVAAATGAPEDIVNHARALREAGRHADAIMLLRTHGRRLEANAAAQALLGRACLDQRDEAGAAVSFDQALRIDPRHGEALLYRASMHFRSAELEAAETLLRRMAEIYPSDAVAKNLLGSVLQARGQLDEAEAQVRAAFALSPDNPDVLMNLGLVLGERGDVTRAMQLQKQAIALKPDLAEAWNNLGFAQQNAGQFAQALESYDRALALKPQFHGAKTNKAFTLFTLGRLAEGWQIYRHRFDQKIQASKARVFPYPTWDGRADAATTLLLWTDQGLGDEILYMSMLHEARARVGRCILECTAKMATLFQRSFPDVDVVPRMKPPHPLIAAAHPHYQLSLIELGAFLRPGLTSIPRHSGYLKPDPDLLAKLRDRYRTLAGGRKIVGVSWRSDSPRTGRFKTMPLADWAQIFSVPDVLFVSLQYGSAQSDLGDGSPVYVDPDIDAFANPDDALAQVAAMDLVITVSNTTAHFAGGLGIPVWTLVATGPGLLWYWFAEGENSPWYPSMRLIRQPQPGVWGDVARRVFEGLRSWAGSGRA